MSEKLQKVLARAGLGSRREIETWIEDGRLMVNGYPALLGTRVEPKDEVKLDGRRLRLVPESLVNRKILMYHKPEGEVTTRKDPEGRPTVFDRLPPMRGSRWVAIGRLDLNTSGLLIFTNDGEMANRLMHPSHEVEREYAVRILGELKPSQRKQLLEGVVLEDGLAKFNSIESRGGSGTNRWYHVTLSEGRTREVRRMFESLQLVVSRLIRVRYGPVSLDPLLKQGMNRLLTLEESDRLCEAVGIEPQAPRAERRREYQQTRRSEPARGRADSDDEFVGEAAPVSARKAKVIGSKADELPLDRVERAAELLRRRREAESAGVEFSGRSGRLSGKRTLRESELRKIAQEKAAEKAKRGERAGGKAGAGRAESDERETPRTRSRTAAADGASRERPVAPGARSAASRIAATRSTTTRSTTTRTSLARSTSYAEREDDAAAPRRAPRGNARTRSGDDEMPRRTSRAAPRSTRSDDETPRRRSAAKPAGARSAAGTRSVRGEDGAGPARSRAAADATERPSRSAGSRSSTRTGAGKSTSTRNAETRGSTSRGTSSRSTSETRSRSAAKPASRSAAGKSASTSSRAGATRSSSPRASGARSSSSERSSSTRPSASPRGGSRSGGSARPSGKGKRTR